MTLSFFPSPNSLIRLKNVARDNPSSFAAFFAVFILGIGESLVGAKYWVWIRELGIVGPLAIAIISFLFASGLPAIILASLWFVRIFFYASYFPLLSKELEQVSDKSIHATVLSASPTLSGIGVGAAT